MYRSECFTVQEPALRGFSGVPRLRRRRERRVGVAESPGPVPAMLFVKRRPRPRSGILPIVCLAMDESPPELLKRLTPPRRVPKFVPAAILLTLRRTARSHRENRLDAWLENSMLNLSHAAFLDRSVTAPVTESARKTT